MRTRPTIAALAVAAVLAVPAGAGAKGVAAADLCGGNGCHRIATAAIRAGIERFTPAPSPDRPEPYLTIRLRERVSNGRQRLVGTTLWLPHANLVRPAGGGPWTTPAPVLARALRAAARGLRRRPAAGLGSVDDALPQARVVEVFAPGEPRSGGGRVPAFLIAAAIAAAAAAAAAAATGRSRPRGEAD
jgi:hypothetical protein